MIKQTDTLSLLLVNKLEARGMEEEKNTIGCAAQGHRRYFVDRLHCQEVRERVGRRE